MPKDLVTLFKTNSCGSPDYDDAHDLRRFRSQRSPLFIICDDTCDTMYSSGKEKEAPNPPTNGPASSAAIHNLFPSKKPDKRYKSMCEEIIIDDYKDNFGKEAA
jgi:hypothetical protein